MAKLLFLFIVVPAVELGLLIQLGIRIVTLPTLGLIAVTGVVGAFLARRQGLSVLRQMQAEMAAGRLPGGSIVDGVIILLAGALLITPGILTDIVGFTCLVPQARRIFKKYLWRRLERAVREGSVQVSVHLDGHGRGSPPPAEKDAAAGDERLLPP